MRAITRQCGNGIRKNGVSISPKADMIIECIKEQPGIHFVYSQFISQGSDYVKERLIKLWGMVDINNAIIDTKAAVTDGDDTP